MKIFSGTANAPLAEKIAHLCTIPVSPLDSFQFPDGEKRIRVLENVVGKHAIIVQPTAPPVDTNYMELFFIVDALKRSGAEFVTAVVPYLGYQRQDHIFRDGEAVSLEVIAKTLSSTGLDNLIVCDLHTIKAPEVFPIPVTHISALPLFAQQIKILNTRYLIPNTVLISPDMGGVRRIKILSKLLDNMPYAVIEKNRDLATGAVRSTGIVEGSIKDKTTALIVDDMISSGSTIVTAEEILRKQGIKTIYVFATHAIFSDHAPQKLEQTGVKKIFVTDSIYIPKEKIFDKLEVISIADIIAKQLREL